MKRQTKTVALILATSIVTTMFTGCLKQGADPAGSSSQATASSAAPSAHSTQLKKDAKVIKIADAVGDSHQNSIVAKKFMEPTIEKRTDGRYDVQVFTNGTLGDDNALTSAVREGTVDIFIGGAAVLAGMVKEVNILDLPFVFDDEKMADEIMDGKVGQLIGKKLEEKGYIMLGLSENGFSQFINNKREIRTPADLEGLKLRVMQNPIRLATYKAYNSNPTPMSFNDVFTAMQQGTVNGMETTIPLIESNKFNEVGKYLTMANNSYFAIIFLMSKKLYDSMSPEDQKLMLQIGKESITEHRKIARELNKSGLDKLKKAGMQVYTLTDAERQGFIDKVKNVAADNISQMGQEVYDLYKADFDRIRAAKKQMNWRVSEYKPVL